MSETNIRPATQEDVADIQAMICELAEFEKMSENVVSTEAHLHEALFGKKTCAEAIVAEHAGEAAAYALFFTNYSTFIGRPGLYLEDVYVKPQHRGKNIGTQVLQALANIASERGYGRMDWSVLDWNQRAIDFYEKHGSTVLQEWRIVRTDADGIAAMARKPKL
ncbi:MAG: ribosomal protein S18 acetylase RimI-like enzyme [Verrucomicrobiales bacterium]|jgi:ribosomal protein S18 acetylase RimI-like enzyme